MRIMSVILAPLLVRLVLILISFIIIALSILNITYGISVTSLFLGIGIFVGAIAYSKSIRFSSVERVLKSFSLILVGGGVIFYLALLILTLMD